MSKLNKGMAVLAIFAALSFVNVTTSVQAAEKVVVEVQNLYCKICAGGVRKKFTKEGARVKQKFDSKTGSATYTIRLKKGEKLSDDVIRKIVKESGADVRSVKR